MKTLDNVCSPDGSQDCTMSFSTPDSSSQEDVAREDSSMDASDISSIGNSSPSADYLLSKVNILGADLRTKPVNARFCHTLVNIKTDGISGQLHICNDDEVLFVFVRHHTGHIRLDLGCIDHTKSVHLLACLGAHLHMVIKRISENDYGEEVEIFKEVNAKLAMNVIGSRSVLEKEVKDFTWHKDVTLHIQPSPPEACYIQHISTGLYLYSNSKEKHLEMRPLMQDELQHYEFQHCKYYGVDDTRNNMKVVVFVFWTAAEQEMLEYIAADKVHNVDLETNGPISPNIRFLSDQDDRWFVQDFVGHIGDVFESLKVRDNYLVVTDGKKIGLKALDYKNILNEKDAIFRITHTLDTST